MSRMNNKILPFTILICSFLLAYQSIYTVSEGFTALLLPLNALKKVTLLRPRLQRTAGLHFKLPFLLQVTQIDSRLHNLSVKKINVLTADQKELLLDYYASWRVIRPRAYYEHTHNNLAETRQQLEQSLRVLLKNQSAIHTSHTLRRPEGQTLLLNTLLTEANIPLKTGGIALVDIGFEAIDFPAETNAAVLHRQREVQIQRTLEQGAIGKTNAENIRANASEHVAVQLAKATEEAATICGQGDAIAAKIYSEAYHKNLAFATFYLKMEAYRKGFSPSLSNSNFLVLNTSKGLSTIIRETPQILRHTKPCDEIAG